MTRRAVLLVGGAVLALAGCVAGERVRADASACSRLAGETPTPPTRPFFEARSRVAEYAGPGRELPPPDEVTEVRIGWFGPADAAHPEAGRMWLAATMAVDEANQAGGQGVRGSGGQGVPFRLLAKWSENPWGSGIEGVAGLVYEEGVWALAGGPDGVSAHLVEQVVAKARLAYVSPVSTDKSTNLVNVPWIFSLAPSDDVLARVLAEAIVADAASGGRQPGGKRGSDSVEPGGLFVISCTDHDSRVFTAELLLALRRLNTYPVGHVDLRPGESDFAEQLDRFEQSRATTAVVIAGPRDSANVLAALRRREPTMPVFGGPKMGRRWFVETAGEAAEGLVFPLLWHEAVAGERSQEFARRFAERWDVEPDYTAAYSFDAMGLLIGAIRRAGLNRALIRDAVRELSPWEGVTGRIEWDPTGQNRGTARLGTVRNGQFVPLE